MLVYSHIVNIAEKYKNNVVVLGTFDGVHIGHQKIIKRAIELAQQIGGKSIVFTFSNHPLEIIAPERAPKRISTNVGKEHDLEALGIDILMNIPFTQKFADISPSNFLKLLKDNLSPKYIVVGPNCTFGYKGEGTPQFLRDMASKYGFIAEIPQAAYMHNKIISSSRVRHAIADGELELANELLGHPFTIAGKVEHGEHRGHQLGVPTANVYVSDKYLLPPDGVYIVTVTLAGKRYEGVANVGDNPTFNIVSRRVEVNILDFNQNIYGEVIQIHFLKKLRDEKKFYSIDELLSQMKNDIKNTKEYFIR
ncbi:bifunctional riboflavin kinase/FAD synthetase [Pectinatus cerevisiiphilus]|uniref:Riboflavin biosynthesis protein n=1 Tax=Pectinatus cerevisiiphilus TaxID=86956 RepID=A0A4R3K5Z4_9FIRM|nr:bifunctional riboflavin kinase/FAD synthetase [Pectinatus cerevisiiphilus]TCS78170.1 riboflavin kinase/FMN adenylyltransferase [Pectinatus cerevisiiphilus]